MDLTRAGYLFAHHYGYRYPAEIRYRLSPHDFYASFARCTCECCCERTRFPAAFERDLVEKRARSTTRSEETTTSSKEDIMLAQNQDRFSDKPGRRNRTTYKRWQIDELERAFCLNPYPTSVFKKALAMRLGLRDSRVQVWFQNRRAKAKRDKRGPTTTPAVHEPETELADMEILSESEMDQDTSCTEELDVGREYTDSESTEDAR